MTHHPLTAFCQKLNSLPGDYSRPVRAFIEHHLGTIDQPAPFTSREPDLTRLDHWLNDPGAAPYAMLTGPAGRGKSTLLAQWAARLEAADDGHILYFPISVRFGTASEVLALRAFEARLLRAYGEWPAPGGDAQSFHGHCRQVLGRPPADGQRVLVIVDGLDEARGWEAGLDLFPDNPPAHLRVLVSANEPLAEQRWAPWLAGEGRGQVIRLPLPALTELDQQNGPSDQGLAPLQARWRAAGLADSQAEAFLNACAVACGPLRAADIRAVAADEFASEAMVRHTGEILNPALTESGEPGTYALRHPALAEAWVNHQLKAAGPSPAWLERFAQYVRTTLAGLQSGALGPSQASAYAVRYGAAHLRLVNAALDAYLPMLDESWERAWETVDGTADGYLTDVRSIWALAGLAGQPGLIIQIRALLARSSIDSLQNQVSTRFILDHARQGRLPLRRALHWARSRSASNERALGLLGLAACLPDHERPAVLAEALDAARQESHDDLWESDDDRAEVLAAVAAQLPEADQPAVLAEALDAARAVTNLGRSARILAAINAQQPAAKRAVHLAEALAQARSERNDEYRVNALNAVADQLPEAERPAVRAEAFHLALTVITLNGDGDPVIYRAGIVSAGAALVAEAAGPAARAATLDQVLAGVRTLHDPTDQLSVLNEIAVRLSPADRLPVLAEAAANMRAAGPHLGSTWGFHNFLRATPASAADLNAEALAIARNVGDANDRAGALWTVWPRVPAGEQPAVLQEAVAAARLIKWEWRRAGFLAELAPRLPAAERAGVLAEALAAARAIVRPNDRAETLAQVAQHLPENQRPAILREAVEAARAGRAEAWYKDPLPGLLAQLAEADQPALWETLLDEIHLDAPDQEKIHRLTELAAQLPPDAEDGWAQAAAIARTIAPGRQRAEALCALADHPAAAERPTLLADALAAARAEDYAYGRCEALLEVAQRQPADAQRAVLAEAIAAGRRVDPRNREAILQKIIAQLPPEADLWLAALSATDAVWDLEAQQAALLDIAEALPAPERLGVLTRALAAARAVWEGEDSFKAVLEIARRAPPEFRPTAVAAALEAARICEHDFQQVSALGAVLEVVPPEQQPRVAAEALVMAIHANESLEILEAAGRWMIPELIPRLFAEARIVIQAKRGPGDACFDLVRLAVMLPEQDRPAVYREAVAGVLADLQNQSSTPTRLRCLAENLPSDAGDLLEQVIAAAQGLKPQDRESVLKAAAGSRPVPPTIQQPPTPTVSGPTPSGRPRLAPEPLPALTAEEARQTFTALTTRLQAAQTYSRSEVLRLLAGSFPVIMRLGGEAAGRETAQAILDALNVWP